MIITTISKYEIKKVYNCSSSNLFIPNKLAYFGEITFYVLREATIKEYVKHCVNEGCAEEMLIIGNYFYEISVD